MAETIENHVYLRKSCPVCLNEKLSAGIPPHVDLKFPLLPVCVETPYADDIFAPFTICLCNSCGLITLKKTVDPEILYRIFHSDGIGKVWDGHYEKFSQLIRKHYKSGRIIEIGAGQGKLIKKLLSVYSSGVEVIDPMYEGPKEGVVVHNKLFTEKNASEMAEEFDAVVSSHTLEHFVEFGEYFRGAWKCLKPGGLLFTSVPNQEFSFAKGYGNQLNFEHPSACTNAHWVYLHYKYGFVMRELSFYGDHSVQMVAQKAEKPLPYEIDAKELSLKILEQYHENVTGRIRKVRQFAKPDKENWLFGASNFSQPLFVYGLEESYFAGVLDNSPLKHNKRLYGTHLVCMKPEDVVPKKSNIRIFLNLGQYNKEVHEQLKALNPSIEFVYL